MLDLRMTLKNYDYLCIKLIQKYIVKPIGLRKLGFQVWLLIFSAHPSPRKIQNKMYIKKVDK